MAVDAIGVRLARLEGGYEQSTARLAVIEQRLSQLDARIGDVSDQLNVRIDGLRTELLQRMDPRFYWILSLLVISILIPIFLRLLNL